LKNACIFISNNFCIIVYVNKTWNGNFLYTADNIHAIYITSVIFPCTVGLETPT